MSGNGKKNTLKLVMVSNAHLTRNDADDGENQRNFQH